MSFVVQNRTYAYDNIGQPGSTSAAGQERNQSQFFPYTPGTDAGYPDRIGQPGATNPLGVNEERDAKNAAVWGYGLEIP